MDAKPTLDDRPNVDASVPIPTPTTGTSTPRATSAATSCASCQVPESSETKEVECGNDRLPQPNKRRLWTWNHFT